MIQEATPNGMSPCWYITESEIEIVRKTGKPFAEFTNTEDFFILTNRIDSVFIQGNIARRDKQFELLNDVRVRYSYLIDFYDRKKVYFTFDRINLYQLYELSPGHPNPILFTLKRVDTFKIIKANQVFMIMPFHNHDLDNFYFNNIKPFLKKEFSIEIYRADDFYNNDIIVETIYHLIKDSEFIIADTTEPNKNAFYELGYASALGKEIVMVQNKTEKKLFFDRAHIRSIFYDATDISSFHFDLKSTIESIRAKHQF
ncbi:MAG TPA: hypothetical protein VMT76_00820 [Puia sp.]|nr:hypothetical protein [Puia sp.]